MMEEEIKDLSQYSDKEINALYAKEIKRVAKIKDQVTNMIRAPHKALMSSQQKAKKARAKRKKKSR